MAKATYYFSPGGALLRAVPCEADKDGNLTREGETVPFCTGAPASESPASGCYVLEPAEKPKKPDKKDA